MNTILNNLSTKAKLVVGFATILVLLAVVVVMASKSLNTIAQSEQHLRDTQFKTSTLLMQLRSHQNFNRAEVLDMMLTNEQTGQRAMEQRINNESASINKVLDELTALNLDPAFQRKVDELKRDVATYRHTREEEIALIYAGKMEKARQLGISVGADQFEKVRSLVAEMGDKAALETDRRLAHDQREADSATRLFVMIGVIALLLAIALVALLNRTLARPLTSIAKVAERVGGGDLTVNLPEETRRDEIGALSQAFRQMVETMRRSTSDISVAINQLGSSASEILAATTQVASGTAETAASINETTTTVEEVRHAVQLSSQKAQAVSDNAQRLVQVSQSGQKAVEESAAGMSHILEQMETIAQTVVRLSEQGQSIGGIIASVTDLADQSNLLAVNAAIEAARAGEQGKGFAVVAQEIKSLAEQSKQATIQVRGILSDVQKATSNAVMATEQGTKAVEAGVKQAAQAMEAIQVLTEANMEAVQNAIQIVASSKQQVVGMDQIGVAMQDINQAGAQNASSMKQMEIAAQDLHRLGEKLKDLTASFKV